MGEKCGIGCPVGKYGLRCEGICECMNGAECDTETGKCVCPNGWSGPKCEKRICPLEFYGENCENFCQCNLNNSISCHPWTGILVQKIEIKSF